jgi:hypothetical protein
MGSAEHCQIGAIEQSVQAFEARMSENGLLYGVIDS